MRTSFCMALLAVTSIQGAAPLTRQLPPSVASCLHDANAREGDRNRRARALTLAKAINTDAIFSDSAGFLYDKSARSAPLIAQ